uniref:Uncharacterized protein n=1 Tax=Acrobeloides nanus TaxID=290746 RepID=A0A914BWV6_9BILA
MKRSFSCSTCNNRNDRVKRRTEIEDFQKMRAYHLKTCTPCAVGSSPRVMKRAADFEDASFDPFSQCDNSCCAYDKCIYTKLIRTSSLSNKHG